MLGANRYYAKRLGVKSRRGLYPKWEFGNGRVGGYIRFHASIRRRKGWIDCGRAYSVEYGDEAR